jgi:Fe-S-cluster containining protein
VKLKRRTKDIDQIEKLQADVEQDWDTSLSNIFEKGQVTCMNCTKPACCNQKTTSWFYEVLPMARYLKDTKQVTPEFLRKLKEEGEQMDAVTTTKWFTKNRPCLLLSKDGWCTVYKYRPMVACASYWVLSPQEKCATLDPNVQINSVNPGYYFQRLTDLSFEIHEDMGLPQDNEKLYIASLPLVLWAALTAWNKTDWVGYIQGLDFWPSRDDLSAMSQAIDDELVQLRA